MKMSKTYTKGFILLSIICSIGLNSCQVTNKYKSPEIDTAKLYREMNPTDTTTIASIPWRQYFTDPYLQSLLEEGLANNYDMQIGMQRIKQAEAALGMARAANLPSVALAGQVSHSRASSYDPTSRDSRPKDVLAYHGTQYSLGVAVSWELDLWGKLNRQSRAKYAQYLNSQEGQNLVQTNLVSGIATMYYNLLALDEQLKASNEAIELLKETVSTMEAMKDAGMMNGAAVEQTKAALYNTQVSIPNLEKGINELENNLSVLIGRTPSNIVRGSLANQLVPNELHVGTPAQMLANRPDVRSAELQFRSAFELKNAAQASFYPSITLNNGSMIGFATANTLSQFFDPKNLLANIIGGITQPLFARKQLTANLKISKAEQEAALLTFKKTVLEASAEVSSIMYSYNASLKKNEFRNMQIESLNKSVEFTHLLLKAGEANYLEVITAEQDLLQAQIGQVDDKLEQLEYNVNLYKALGGGIN